jgi:hypothetical protein
MATPQPVRQADSPQSQRYRGLPWKYVRRIIFILVIITLLFFIAGGITWVLIQVGLIKASWSDKLFTILTGLGGATAVLLAIFGIFQFFLSLIPNAPDSSTTSPSTSPPIQNIIYVGQPPSHSLQPPLQPSAESADSKNTSVHSDDKVGKIEEKQPLTSPSRVFPQGETGAISRDELRRQLNKCLPTILENIIFSINPPPGVMSPSNTPPSQRVIELIKWAESDGPGLAKLYDVYLQETGKIDPKGIPTNFQSNTERAVEYEQQKSINMPEYRSEQDIEKLSPHEQFFIQACGYITEACKCVQDAQAPYSRKEYIKPKNIKKSIQLLNTINAQTQNLRVLLDTHLPLPASIASYHQELIRRTYIVDEQLEQLIQCIGETHPACQDIEERFAVLTDYLSKMVKLFQCGDTSS